ncbi:MAG: SET domain-containing protein [Melioribacteraceae bacterium]|nr:SET domain-containing protein [Melioribacteraceae bacterium]MCF8352991.1 SET domain-containing protein [Melioribacteraceae bacterium]MCF8392882.1 SET domain-containing protein [Melioribacteraceae bacterium]MCF8417824.1 SET domain-containing protein [Melioribacteraceae bacterium]
MKTPKSYEEFVVVKDSEIHGKGIFAGCDIPKKSLVMPIKGEVIDGYECERREEEDDNVYIFWNGETYIDTAKTQTIKFINHDCEPNCDVLDGDEESLLLYSNREIKKGEEITIDYGYEEIYESCTCRTCMINNQTFPEAS